MTIWELLGFGINSERIAKYNQKVIEQQNQNIQALVRDINRFGIKKIIERPGYDIKDIKAVLKYFDEPPIKSTYWEKNWIEAKQWLYEQEHLELSQLKITQEELKKQKEKIQKLEKKLGEYEINK